MFLNDYVERGQAQSFRYLGRRLNKPVSRQDRIKAQPSYGAMKSPSTGSKFRLS